MIHFPLRRQISPLILTAGFLGLTQVGSAQISPATDTVHTDAEGRHIAPHDTFYTLEYVSVRTDKGVEGFPPGTEVHLVSVNREARTLTVSDGHANIDLAPEKLTNDLDIAALVQAKDNANQERIAAYRQAQAEAYQKYQKEVADYTARDLEKRQQEIRDADARAQQQANANQAAQTVNTNASNNGYYNQGGNGYGSPYGYFIDLNAPAVVNNAPLTNTTNQTGGNKGTTSSTQNGNQVNGARSNGPAAQTSGAASSGSAGAGGKKP